MDTRIEFQIEFEIENGLINLEFLFTHWSTSEIVLRKYGRALKNMKSVWTIRPPTLPAGYHYKILHAAINLCPNYSIID